MALTATNIAFDLRRLGLEDGACVALHSSLSRMGYVEGGAGTVIDAFLAVLGPKGTLMVPTFTYGLAGTSDGPVFDRAESRARTGRIPETLRQRPDAIRSLHPTHSVAAIGAMAEELTSDHFLHTPLGRGSPFHRLAIHHGFVLLLGCGHDTDSLIHVGEVLAGVPYVRVFCWLHLGCEPKAHLTDDDGHIRTLAIYECPGCSKSFPRIEPELRRRGHIRDGSVGAARAQLFRAEDLLATVVDVLTKDPQALLCSQGTCPPCDVHRHSLSLPTPPPLPPPATWFLS